MTSETGSLAGGFIAISGNLDPWPFPEPSLFTEISLDDGFLLIGGHQDGRVEFSLRTLEDGEEGFLGGIMSPIIVVGDNKFVVLSVQWLEGCIVDAHINGIEVYPNCHLESIILPPLLGSDIPDDFSSSNEKARQFRTVRLEELKIRPDRKHGDKNYLMESLRGEVEQIGDLIESIKSGREAHVAGLAARVRLLTYGHPFGLLQNCAALIDQPLIIYSCRNPKAEPPLDDALTFCPTGSGEPNEFYSIPVDLDVWLDFPAFVIGRRMYTHLEIIRDFGDTIGAHRDPGITKPVRAYQTVRSRLGGTRYRDLQRYLVEVSEILLVLARGILRAADLHDQR